MKQFNSNLPLFGRPSRWTRSSRPCGSVLWSTISLIEKIERVQHGRITIANWINAQIHLVPLRLHASLFDAPSKRDLGEADRAIRHLVVWAAGKYLALTHEDNTRGDAARGKL